MGLYKYYEGAGDTGKTLIIVGGLVAAGAAYFLGKSIVKRIKHQKDLKGQKQVVNDAGTAVKQLKDQGKGPSWDDGQYSSWASSIQTAFQGCDPWSDDVAAVLEAVRGMKNDADMYKLISAFGVRKWDECGWGGDAELDLVGGVRNELDSLQIGLVNQELAKKGIAFRF